METGSVWSKLQQAGQQNMASEVRSRMGGSHTPARDVKSFEGAARHIHAAVDIDRSSRAGQASGIQSSDGNGNSFGFDDILDAINPLHHIPVVGNAYRAATGDELHHASRILGGALYGGPVGAVGGVANMVVVEATGKDVGAHVMGAVRNVVGGADQGGFEGARGKGNTASRETYISGSRDERMAQWESKMDSLPERQPISDVSMPAMAALDTPLPGNKPGTATATENNHDRPRHDFVNKYARRQADPVSAQYSFNS